MESNLIIVPPRTSKMISEYVITNLFLNTCDMQKYPNRKSIKTLEYDQENSPFNFSNLITYSISGDTNRLETNFYVKSISNLPISEVFEMKTEVVCGRQTAKKVRTIKSNGPETFYIEYYLKNNGQFE
jgi:hypothetical protein